MSAENSELNEYAEFMGVNLAREAYLLEILQQGLNAPLPSGWDYKDRGVEVEFISPTGQVLHEHPIDKTIRKKIADARPQNVTHLIAMRKPSDEEIQSVLSYFGVDFESTQMKLKCVEFLTTIPKNWEIYQFQGDIFFAKGDISTFQHPLEQEFRDLLHGLMKSLQKGVGESKEYRKTEDEQMTPQKTSRDGSSRVRYVDGGGENFKESFAASSAECYIVVPEAAADYIRLFPEISVKTSDEAHGKYILELSKDDLERLRAIYVYFDAYLTEMKNHHAELVYEEMCLYYQQVNEVRSQYYDYLRNLRYENLKELEKLSADHFDSVALMQNYLAEKREDQNTEELYAQLKYCNAELTQYYNYSLQLYSALDYLQKAQVQLREYNAEITYMEVELRRAQELSRTYDRNNQKAVPFVKDLKEMIDDFTYELYSFRSDIRTYICNYQARYYQDGMGSRYIDFYIAEFYRRKAEVYKANVLYYILELGLNEACGRLGTLAVENTVKQVFYGLSRSKYVALYDWKAEFKDRLG